MYGLLGVHCVDTWLFDVFEGGCCPEMPTWFPVFLSCYAKHWCHRVRSNDFGTYYRSLIVSHYGIQSSSKKEILVDIGNGKDDSKIRVVSQIDEPPLSGSSWNFQLDFVGRGLEKLATSNSRKG